LSASSPKLALSSLAQTSSTAALCVTAPRCTVCTFSYGISLFRSRLDLHIYSCPQHTDRYTRSGEDNTNLSISTTIMDSRQSHPFSRPPDRPLIHNPNHQTGPQPQHPPFYPPVSQQPPLQVPFPDPFQRRDPFMPSAQGQRRDSYGIGGRDTLGLNGDRPPLGGPWGNGAGTF